MKTIQAEPKVSSVNEQNFTSERPLLPHVLLSITCGIVFMVISLAEVLDSGSIFIGILLIMFFSRQRKPTSLRIPTKIKKQRPKLQSQMANSFMP